LSETEAAGESSPASADNQAEETRKPPKVTMINGKKVGCVFPSKDKRVQPGETYQVSESKALQMEQIPGQRRE